MRGEHLDVAQDACVVGGIIPACAGSTIHLPQTFNQIRDHPRMRGEHHGADGASVRAEGSSPHAREARPDVAWLPYIVGIIPACAGSTRKAVNEGIWRRDHPRMRGEHTVGDIVITVPEGSSPHARGAPIRSAGILTGSGIIPACAGSTREDLST